MAKRMGFSVVGLPHYTIWHLYEPSVDDIRHMEEMEEERKAREQAEQEMGNLNEGSESTANTEATLNGNAADQGVKREQQSSSSPVGEALKDSEAGPAKPAEGDVAAGSEGNH